MKSFLLNRRFVRKLAGSYHDDKTFWFRVFSEESERRVSGESQEPMPFSKTRIEHQSLAQLTAVDGAAVLSYDLTVLAFGAEIRPIVGKAGRGDRINELDSVLVSLPFEKSKRHKVPLSDLGGTRHKSAAQFVFDQNDADARALVVSADGGISLYGWDQEKKKVSVTRGAEFLLL